MKAKTATKKKPLVDLDENAEESFMDVDSDEPGPSAQREAPDPNRKKKTASEQYTKVSHIWLNPLRTRLTVLCSYLN